MARMKIVVKLVVDIDPEAWAQAYGCGETRNEIREDVKRYMLNQTQQSPGVEESDGTVVLG